MSQEKPTGASSLPIPGVEEDNGELMYVRCSLCGEWLDSKPGRVNWISHGVCPVCYVKEVARIELFLEERRKAKM